jgi:hypothetical protein
VPDETSGAAPAAWLRLTLAIAAAVQLAVINAWPGFPSPNERARAYQALAVAARGSLEIGPELARHGGIEDVAVAGGAAYPNKAPGMLPLLLPAALAARAAAGGSPARELALTLLFGRLLAASLPFLLTVALLARRLGPRPSPGAALAVAAFALASPALPASLLLFSHSLAAFLLLAAFALLHAPAPPDARRAAAAGALIGWAVTAEYPALVPGGVLAALALLRLRPAGAAALALGGAVPALALAAYNAACFGSPFALSSGREAHAAYGELAAHGVFGVGAPALPALAGLLVSPARGIVVWWPLLLLAAAGVRRRAAPAAADDRAPLILAPLALLVAMSGYPNWHGGWFAGPRYLLAVLPLVTLLAARGADRLWRGPGFAPAAVAAALWGAAQVWPLLSSFPFPPEDYPLPALTLALPLLRAGVLAPSWLPATVLATVLTALAAAAVALLARTARLGARGAAAALAAAAVAAAAAAALPPPRTWKARLEMAVVHDTYALAPRPGALEALAAAATTPAQRARLAALIAERDRTRAGPAPGASRSDGRGPGGE